MTNLVKVAVFTSLAFFMFSNQSYAGEDTSCPNYKNKPGGYLCIMLLPVLGEKGKKVIESSNVWLTCEDGGSPISTKIVQATKSSFDAGFVEYPISSSCYPPQEPDPSNNHTLYVEKKPGIGNFHYLCKVKKANLYDQWEVVFDHQGPDGPLTCMFRNLSSAEKQP